MDIERETEGKWEEERGERWVNVDSFPLQKH